MAVVDDHDLFREGIRLVLGQVEGIEMIYDTSDGKRFISLLEDLPLDMVLMDIEMPEQNGIQTTIEALRIKPELEVIALTMFSDIGHYHKMIQAGARGFLLKKANKQELAEAIQTVHEGGNYISPDMLRTLGFQQTGHALRNEGLTSREIDVMLLICNGLTTQEISEKLFISTKTVETHRCNIYLKSGVRNMVGLIIWAIKNQYFAIE